MRQVLSTLLKVRNDEDQGPCSGSWALDNLFVILQVFVSAPGSYTYTAAISGSWKTFGGARSPEACVTQTANQCGAVVGFLTGAVERRPCRRNKKTSYN